MIKPNQSGFTAPTIATLICLIIIILSGIFIFTKNETKQKPPSNEPVVTKQPETNTEPNEYSNNQLGFSYRNNLFVFEEEDKIIVTYRENYPSVGKCSPNFAPEIVIVSRIAEKGETLKSYIENKYNDYTPDGKTLVSSIFLENGFFDGNTFSFEGHTSEDFGFVHYLKLENGFFVELKLYGLCGMGSVPNDKERKVFDEVVRSLVVY